MPVSGADCLVSDGKAVYFIVDKDGWPGCLIYGLYAYLCCILVNEQSAEPTAFFQQVSTAHTYIAKTAYPRSQPH